MRSVFISSTFKDMQAERDYLHEKIFPKVRRLTARYGEDIQELDLRWGVDTYKMNEEESSYQVLKVCIDAIDRCRPYIIVLLGDRYGWIPDTEVVESLRDDRITAQYEDSMSITNLEIKYGALSEEETLKRCIFCFRDPDFIRQIPEEKRSIYLAESPEHAEKLALLKQQIREKKDAVILDYKVQWDETGNSVTGLDDFGENIYRLLEEMLIEELKEHKAKDAVQQYLLDAQCTKERYLSTYTPRLFEEKEALHGLWFMAGDKYGRYHSKVKNENGNEQCIHLTGPAGCGKSALIACLEEQVRAAGGQTILYFSGNPGCQNVNVLKSVIIYRMEEILQLEHNLQPEDQNVYLNELDRKLMKVPVFCFIDALDQLFPNQKSAYLDLLELCPNLFVITSSLNDFPYEKALLRAKRVRCIQVQSFTDRDKKHLIQKTCSYRGKKIDHSVEEMICQKKESVNPLFLSLLLQRLFSMRQEEFKEAEALAPGMDGLHLYMHKMLKETPEQMSRVVISLFDHVSEIFADSFFKTISGLIAFADTGLSEREIADIFHQQSLEFSQLKFQEILYYLYDVFAEQGNGAWGFAHRIFYEAVQEELHAHAPLIRQYFIDYSAVNPEFMEREGYIHILKMKDPLGKEVLRQCGHWKTKAAVKALVIQLFQDDEHAESYFTEMICNARSDEAEELLHFWKTLVLSETNEKVTHFQKIIYEKMCTRKDLSAELKLTVLIDLMYTKRLEKYDEQLRMANTLLASLPDSETKVLRKIELKYIEYWNQFQTGQAEEMLPLIDALLPEARNLIEKNEVSEDALFWYMKLCRFFAERVYYHQKLRIPVYLEQALDALQKHPELAQRRRIRTEEINIYLEATRHYEKSDPERGKQAAEKALFLSRKLSEEDPCTEVLAQLARTLNFYGHDVGGKRRYQYRYESLQVQKRAYQLAQNNYCKFEVADQARFFAADVAKQKKQKELEDVKIWDLRKNQAWELAFSYFEELYHEFPDYDSLQDTYVETLLDCAQEAESEGHAEKAVECAEKAYYILKQSAPDETNLGKNYHKWLAAEILAENLDAELRIDEAVPYAREQLVSAKKVWEQKKSNRNLSAMLLGFLIASRVLYHAGNDTDAQENATEGIALLEQCRKEYGKSVPSFDAELNDILEKIERKRNGNEPAVQKQLTEIEPSQKKEEIHVPDYIIDPDKTIFTLLRILRDSCPDALHKSDTAKNILNFWRENYQSIDLHSISVENLFLLQELERLYDYAPTPLLVEELTVRLNDKELLHNFFRNLPIYYRKDDWKRLDRRRKYEIKDIFNRLLEQDLPEWGEDFHTWIRDNLWIAKEMDFFQKPENIANDPDKAVLYDVYREYLIYFADLARQHMTQRIKDCNVGEG